MVYVIFTFGIVVGLVVAISIWKLLRTPTQDSEGIWENCTDENILREAVRLAELKIEEFSNIIKILEHKAIALVTLCFAIMGYFYTIKWSCNFSELLRGEALIFLFITSLFGIRVLFLEFIGIAGINPKASLWRAKYHKSNENIDDYDSKNEEYKTSKLLLYTLWEYHISIETSKGVARKKVKELKIAVKFLFGGISALIGWIVANLLFSM